MAKNESLALMRAAKMKNNCTDTDNSVLFEYYKVSIGITSQKCMELNRYPKNRPGKNCALQIGPNSFAERSNPSPHKVFENLQSTRS